MANPNPELSMKIDIHPKNFPIDITLCVGSESAIRNMIALRNLEIAFKTGFDFYLPEATFYSVGT